MLTLPLPRPLASGESIVATFNFTLNLPQLDPYGWAPVGNAGWGPSVVQMGDWHPILVPYIPGSGWRTWQFTPVGDPVISQLADYEVRINTAPEIWVAAPGLIGQEGDTRIYKLQSARAFAFLASPDYLRYAGNAAGVPIQLFISPNNQQVGPSVLQTVQNALNLYTELYGPYPYPEFVIAENGYLTAMEYSGIVSLSGFGFEAYNGRADSLLIAITAHEVAHQWWYGAVGNDQINEPWLDESLAMISELLYYEQYHPELREWWWQFRVDRWNPAGFVDVSIHEYTTSESFVHNMYGQAAYFIRDLREVMGDVAFKAFLSDYYLQNQFKFVTRADFFTNAQANSTADLTPLFAQYFRE